MDNNKNKVLALKYRPKNFKELIGQSIMVETITNSIKLNKLPNAYLLTGIRGVGKTTTARLIATALNCNKNFLNEENCECSHCEEITNSKHLDVLEMDAASRTGIDDVRELIESSKYNPTSAKYKIIILDEVHMLSKQAFNGLLKTLEEPPPHLKFIFATTEVKKIPVTIVSRCQRFDLHRVSVKDLLKNLGSGDYSAGTVIFKSVHPRWSYVKLDSKKNVVEAAEKVPISNNATAGTYFFKSGKDFVNYTKKMIMKDANTDGAFFICPVFNEMILDGRQIVTTEIEPHNYHSLMSPSLIEEYRGKKS